jgi:molybdopterin converting factor small subunit
MKVSIRYSAQLKTAVGRSLDVLELPDNCTLETLFTHLAAHLEPAAAAHLLNSTGTIRPGLLIVVNQTVASSDAAATTRLHADDTVLLLPPIAGG